jgi:hypothetical protein
VTNVITGHSLQQRHKLLSVVVHHGHANIMDANLLLMMMTMIVKVAHLHPSSDTVLLNNMSKDSKINRTTTNISACGVPIKCDACPTQQFVCGAHLSSSTMPPDVWTSKCYPLLTCYECKTERCRQHIVWHCPDFDCCGIAYCIPCWDTKGYTKCVSQVTGFFHCWNCGLKTIG